MLPAAPATKVTLPLAVTEGDTARKPRVARLKAGAETSRLPGRHVDLGHFDRDGERSGCRSVRGRNLLRARRAESSGVRDPGNRHHSGVGTAGGATTTAQIEAIRWTGQRCRIDFAPADTEVVAEVRLAPGDSGSVVGGPKQPSDPGEIKVLVDEDRAAEGTTAYVVLLAPDGAVLAQRKTTVGGS